MIRYVRRKGENLEVIERVENLDSFEMGEDVIWVDVVKPDSKEIKWLEEKTNFHKLSVEDCLDLEHIPKLEIYDDYMFMRFVSIEFEEKKYKFDMKNVNFFMGKNFLVTVSVSENEVIETEFKRHLSKTNGFKSIDLFMYHVLDLIMDMSLMEIGKFGQELSDIEGDLLKSLDASMLKKMMKLRKALYRVHRMAVPQLEVVHRTLGNDVELIRKSVKPYFRDLHDDVYRFLEILVSYRDQVSSAVDFFLSLSSHRMNEVIKIMTVFATVLLPLTFITGVYGMNFKFMPELEWEYGYLAVWIFMILFALILLWVFKRKKWF